MAENQGVHESSIESLDILLKGSFDIAHVASYLDELDAASRVAQVGALTRPAMAALYEAAKGMRKLTLEQLLPSDVAELTELAHQSRGSHSFMGRFARVFCRPKRDAKELWGYNRVGGFAEALMGPGYFVAYEGPGAEVLVDYTRVPAGKPESWPEIVPNQARLGRFVYAGTIEALRSVSSHVTVSRAIRDNQMRDSWCVLCRA